MMHTRYFISTEPAHCNVKITEEPLSVTTETKFHKMEVSVMSPHPVLISECLAFKKPTQSECAATIVGQFIDKKINLRFCPQNSAR